MLFHITCVVKLPSILAKVADTTIQNTSTTGMHKDVLHILNNYHPFGITGMKINLARTEKDESDHSTGSETH
jgi:hypothetical protein